MYRYCIYANKLKMMNKLCGSLWQKKSPFKQLKKWWIACQGTARHEQWGCTQRECHVYVLQSYVYVFIYVYILMFTDLSAPPKHQRGALRSIYNHPHICSMGMRAGGITNKGCSLQTMVANNN